jgi:hypothetical protein
LNRHVIAVTPRFTAFFTDFTAFFAARLVFDAEDRMEGERQTDDEDTMWNRRC